VERLYLVGQFLDSHLPPTAILHYLGRAPELLALPRDQVERYLPLNKPHYSKHYDTTLLVVPPLSSPPFTDFYAPNILPPLENLRQVVSHYGYKCEKVSESTKASKSVLPLAAGFSG